MESQLSALSAYLLVHSSQPNRENLLVYLFLRGLVLTSLVLLRLSSSLLRLTPISLMKLNDKNLLSEKICYLDEFKKQLFSTHENNIQTGFS